MTPVNLKSVKELRVCLDVKYLELAVTISVFTTRMHSSRMRTSAAEAVSAPGEEVLPPRGVCFLGGGG